MSQFTIGDVPWSAPHIVDTKSGKRQAREWKIPPGHPFWKLWRTQNLKQQGYTVSKWKGDWIVTEWRMPDGAQSESARAATEAAQRSNHLQSFIETEEPELPPELKKRFEAVERIYAETLAETGNDYSYQLPAIKRLALSIEAFDGALDASDTGTGKTSVACGVARTLGRVLFVICPKAVIPPWERMAERFGVDISIINYEMLRTGNTEFGQWVEERTSSGRVITKFRYDLDRDNDTLFVFDECHRLKDYRTQNCAMGLAAIEAGYKVMGLSATAADNPMHMKFVSLLTGLIRRPLEFYGWMSMNGVKKGRWGLEFVGGRSVLSRIHRQIFPLRGSRIRIADLGDRFPQTTIISEAYEMDEAKEIQVIYDAMHAEITKLEKRIAKDGAAARASILVQILRARQKVELLKVPTLVAMAKDGIDENNSVIIIVNFEDTVRALAKRLRVLGNTITGSDKAEDRQDLIDRFNADDEDILIMNIKAGGLGISLHGDATKRTRLVLISPTFSGIDLKQALGRAHRAGGARSIQKIIWAANTIEEKTCSKVRARMQRVSIFNDDKLDESLAI